MLHTILLDPNNRLLNGATADFGLFGAQPGTSMLIGAPGALPIGLITTPAPAAAGDAAPHDDSAAIARAPALDLPPIEDGHGASALPFAAATIMPLTTPNTIEPGVPSAVGAGSVSAPIGFSPPLSTPLPHTDTADRAGPVDLTPAASTIAHPAASQPLDLASASPVIAAATGDALDRSVDPTRAGLDDVSTALGTVGSTTDFVRDTVSSIAREPMEVL